MLIIIEKECFEKHRAVAPITISNFMPTYIFRQVKRVLLNFLLKWKKESTILIQMLAWIKKLFENIFPFCNEKSAKISTAMCSNLSRRGKRKNILLLKIIFGHVSIISYNFVGETIKNSMNWNHLWSHVWPHFDFWKYYKLVVFRSYHQLRSSFSHDVHKGLTGKSRVI